MRRRIVLGTCLAVVAAGFLPRVQAAGDNVGIILEKLYALRRESGLPRLAPHTALMEMARHQALYMHRLGEVTHVGPDGGDPPARAVQAGYCRRILSEALAESGTGPSETIAHWLVHEMTRTVLLDPQAREVGVFGIASGQDTVLWNLVSGSG